MRRLREVPLPWKRWSRRAVLAVAIVAYAVALSLFLQSPTDLGLLVPGPARDTLEMVSPTVAGPQGRGHLFATTVGTVPRTTVLNLLEAALIPAASAIPSQRLLPQGGSVSDFQDEGRKEMEESKAAAQVAALRHVGIGVLFRGDGAEITGLSDPVPPGVARGDVILRLGDSPVSTAWDLERLVHDLTPGQTARLYLTRGATRFAVEVPVRRTDQGGPTLGIGTITLRPRVVTPERFQISTADILGPSAGLMIALAISDRLSPQPLTKGHAVAGTGTINPSGGVGPVGGLAQKVAGAEGAGAEYFLVPPQNYDEAAAAAQRIRVVRVTSLNDALRFLQSLPAK